MNRSITLAGFAPFAVLVLGSSICRAQAPGPAPLTLVVSPPADRSHPIVVVATIDQIAAVIADPDHPIHSVEEFMARLLPW